MRVREHAQDAELSAKLFCVDPFEATPGHRRRRPVAEEPRDPKPEAGRLAVARGVERRHQQRRALQPVARLELELDVEVAPVGRQARGGRVPRVDELRQGDVLSSLGLVGADDLEDALDPIRVDALEEPADDVRRVPCPSPRRAE